MANTVISRTIVAPTDGKKHTISMWIKRASKKLTAEETLVGVESGNTIELIKFGSNGKLYWYTRDAAGNAAESNLATKFIDSSSWYHFVFAYDSTQGSAANQKKVWVNGVQHTWENEASVQSNAIAGTQTTGITYGYGREGGGTSYYFDGLMSHVHHIDGTCYQASDFGSTDATTGEWKLNTSPTVTYGNNGHWILKDGNVLTDSSTNSNNFSTGSGSVTHTEDCPSNNFCTLNPHTSHSFANKTTELEYLLASGNTSFSTDGNNSYKQMAYGTLGVTKGKYYWEQRVNDATYYLSGVCYEDLITTTNNDYWDDSRTLAVAIHKSTGTGYLGVQAKASQTISGNIGLSDGDIMMFALDMDNYRFFAGKNGTWFESGDPTTSTGDLLQISNISTIGTGYINSGEFVFPFVWDSSSSQATSLEYNFGNGTFANAQISGTLYPGADGKGKFKYQPPTGYSCLSTKGLNN
tara:strand:- start:1057 stop:2454 length:1398 start_codon:yes stop_codon:yes gene_type:complete